MFKILIEKDVVVTVSSLLIALALVVVPVTFPDSAQNAKSLFMAATEKLNLIRPTPRSSRLLIL